jgi:hypothetical protein
VRRHRVTRSSVQTKRTRLADPLELDVEHRVVRDLAPLDGSVQGAAGGGMHGADAVGGQRSTGLLRVGADRKQARQHRGRLALAGPPDQPHSRVELLDVGVAQIGQPDVAEARLQVELDVVLVGQPGRRLEGELASQPVVQIPREGQPTVGADVGALVATVQDVGQCHLCLAPRVIRAVGHLPTSATRLPRRVVADPPAAVPALSSARAPCT